MKENEQEAENTQDEMLSFFKALADANRLKIVGLLANQSYTVEQLAAILNLGASTVSHHLAKLSEIGLVSARAESYYNYYKLETDRLEQLSKRLLSREGLPKVDVPPDAEAFERKVLRDYLTADGRIKAFPAQQKKFLVILKYVLRAFAPGMRYSEKQVNEMLLKFNEDVASLRREMIVYGFMERQGGGGEYWVKEPPLD